MLKSIVGGVLALMAATFGAHHAAVAAAPTPVAPAAQSQSAAPATATTHTVQPGDTISGIAASFGISEGALVSANGLNVHAPLKLGRHLVIPIAAPKTASGAAPQKMHRGKPVPSVSLTASAVIALGTAPGAGDIPQTDAAATAGPGEQQSRDPPSGSGATTDPQPAPAASASAFVTQSQFNAGLASLRQLISQTAWPATGAGAPITVQSFAPSQRIDQLSNITVSGVSGLTVSDIPSLPYLPTSGGTLTGLGTWASGFIAQASSTIAGNLSITGALALSGGTTLSSTGTTTLAGGFTVSGSSYLATTTVTGGLTVNGNTNITSGGELTVGDKVIAPGEIGLGTTTPGAKLAVQSTIANQTGFLLYGASGQSAPLMDLYNFSGLNLFRVSSAGDTTVGGMFAATGTTTLATTTVNGSLTVNGNTNITQGGELTVGDKVIAPGEIGVGTSTPAGKLAVQGTITAEPTLLLYGASSQTAPLIDAYTFAGTNLLRLTSGGFLGIGQATPSYALDVAGAGHFTRFVDAANFVATSSGATTLLNGALTVNGNTTLANATTTSLFVKSALAASAASFGATATSTFSTAGALTLASALTVPNGGTGATTFGQGWIYSNGGTGALAASTSPTVASITATSTTATSTIGTGGLVVGNNSFVVQQGSGNVGIGTASPGYTLDVQGAGQTNLRVKANADGVPAFAAFGNPTGGEFWIGRESSGGGNIITGSSAYAAAIADRNGKPIQFGTNDAVRMTIASGGNVGIGTTSPQALLGLQGAIGVNTSQLYLAANGNVGIGTNAFVSGAVSSGTLFQLGPSANNTSRYRMIFGQYDSTATYPQLLFSNPGSNFMAMGVSTAGDLVFGSTAGTNWASQQLVLQQTTGNVGIGTTSPATTLSVSGNGYFTGGVGIGATNTSINSNIPLTIQYNASDQNGIALNNLAASGPFYGLFTNSTFEGGIGAVGNWIGGSNTSQDVAVGAVSGHGLQFFVNNSGTPAEVITSGANVGIGTTSPAATLHIAGAGAASKAQLAIQNTGGTAASGAGNGAGITFWGSDMGSGSAGRVGYIAQDGGGSNVFRVSNDQNSDFIFQTNAAERLRLNANIGNKGQVTIVDTGHTSSSGSLGAAISGYGSDIGSGSTGRSWYIGNDGGTQQFNIFYQQNAPMAFFTNATQQMTILGNGNVGIGTTTPDQKLSVFSNTTPSLEFTALSGAAAWTAGIDTADGNKFKISSSTAVGTNPRLTIDGSGNVGIGTASPGYLSSILTAGRFLTIDDSASGGLGRSVLELSNSSNVLDGNGIGQISYDAGPAHNQVAAIIAFADGNSNDAASLRFYTSPSGGSVSERMRIDKSGNVGIGTTSPATTLSVAGNGYLTGGLGVGTLNTTAGTLQTTGNVGIGDASGWAALAVNGNIGVDGTNQLIFGDAAQLLKQSTNTLLLEGRSDNTIANLKLGTGGPTITGSANNLGIGTTTPIDALSVARNTPGSELAAFQNTSASGYSSLGFYDSNGTERSTIGFANSSANAALAGTSNIQNMATDFQILGGSSGLTPLIMVKNSGNVGIGTTSPNAKLQVAGGRINFGSATDGLDYAVLGKDIGGNAFIDANVSGAPFSIYTNNSGTDAARLTVASTGKVGIGTTTPTNLLHLVGLPGQLKIDNNNTTNNQQASIMFASNGTEKWDFGIDSGGNGTKDFFIYDATAGQQRLLINTAGNVGIGTTSPQTTLEVAGSGNGLGQLKLTNSAISKYAGFGISDGSHHIVSGDVSGDLSIFVQSGNINFGIANGNTNAAMINSSGNVGVATLAAGTANSLCYNTSAIAGMNTLSTCSSDQRLKQDITPLDASSTLAQLMELDPVSFDWNPAFASGTPEQFGLIAQEVEKIWPNLVSTTSPTALTPDGTLSLNFNGLYGPIIASIQELAHISGDFQSNLIAWLGSASNGIQDLFANNIYATHGNFSTLTASTTVSDTITANQKFCIGSTCINEAQLAAILAGQSGGSQSSGQGSGGSSGDQATSSPDTPPVIQVNGDNPATIEVGTTYQDLGATITDPQADLNLGISVSVDGGATTTPDHISLDTSTSGPHTISYFATDQSGEIGYATRSVIVEVSTSTP